MTSLVTGGAGFIGSHLADELVTRGEKVTVFDDLSAGKLKHLDQLLEKDQIEFIEGSVLDRGLLEPLIAKSSIVYHLAAVLGVEKVCREPIKTLDVNIDGTRNVLELSRKYEKKVVLASSSEIYGKLDSKPVSENENCLVGPTSVTRWVYAVSKLADEHLAWAIMKNIPIVILRYFNVYGPRIDTVGYGSVIAHLVEQAIREQPITVFGDGNQARCFTYITDAVEATIIAGENIAGDVFNIGSNFSSSINDLAEIIRKLAGSNSEIVHTAFPRYCGPFEEVHSRIPDIRRAKGKMGFEARVCLIEGLSKTIEWMRSSVLLSSRKG